MGISRFLPFFNKGEQTSAESLPVAISSEQMALLTEGGTSYGNFGIDASGRQRVGQITTLFDGKTLGADDSDMFSNVGTGSVAWSNNTTNLSVTSGQYMIRQTKRWFPYFSGKSQLIEITMDNFQTETGVLKRVGYFSSSAVAPYTASLDGLFVEDDGTKKMFKIYNNGTEKVSVDFTAMDNYSLISGYDYSKFTVMAVDFLWLGGAICRIWLKTDLGFVLLHTINYSGTQTGTFTLSPNQPIRYEVRGISASGSLRYICAQVATEGSLNEAGKTRGIFNSADVITNSTSTTYVVLGLKKQITYRDIAVQILNMGAVNTSQNDAGMLLLLKNPTLSGALSYVNDGKIQTAIGTGQTVTGNGLVISAGGSGLEGSSDIMKENFLSFLGNSITNTLDEYVLAYRPSTANQSIRGFFNIKEY